MRLTKAPLVFVCVLACGDSGNANDAAAPDAKSDVTTDASVLDVAETSTADAPNDTTAPDASGADHLLISEIGVSPAGGEFVEIYNPGSASVDLTDYYLSDNSVYYAIAAGTPWAPITTNPGTDFLVQFPSGTVLAPGAAVVVAGSKSFETQFAKCADFILDTANYNCTSGTSKAMVVPTNGGLDATKQGTLLSDAREMVMLFHWDGKASKVEDVDYVTWGTAFEAGSRADKTGVGTYAADTAVANQSPAPAPTSGQSIERCSTTETGEKTTGGNGMTGHDETSESLGTSFKIQATPSPGTKNACL